MKKFAKRLTALTLALALAVGMAGRTAFASWALGEELTDRTVTLAEGVKLTNQALWSTSRADLRTENYITYTPGSGVMPMVYSGTYVTSRHTVASAAANLEKQGYRVIAGVNGSFFNGGDGTVVGMLMTEGVIRALNENNYALLGFTKDGRVLIDESGITKTVSWETEGVSGLYHLYGFNTYRHSNAMGGLYLYNQDYSSEVTYDADRGCVAVVLSPWIGDGETGDDPELPKPDDGDTGDGPEPSEPDDGESGDGPEPSEPDGGETGDGPELSEPDGGETGDGPELSEPDDGEAESDSEPSEPNRWVTMNGSLTLSVEAIMDTKAGDAFNGQLTDGRYMLYANYYDGNDALLDALRSLTPGQRVTVTVSCASEQWADVVYGVSGLYTLLRDGEIVSGLLTAANPYTAVGVKADGTAVFYTIDGRQSGYSIGATYAQVAQRLQELGCVTAVAMDGGGSTTVGATLPGQQKFKVLNRPSDGWDRSVNNSIFLVVKDGAGEMDPGFYLSSDTQVVLTGASLNVSAAAYDQWGEAASGMSPDWSATGGTIVGDGLTAVFTAGNTAGTYAVSAGSGSDLPVRVVSQLSRLTVSRENGAPVSSLLLQVRDTVDLSASGRWWNLDVAMGDEDVTWTASGGIGTIDAQGRFTAGKISASGEITASAGGKTVTVSVTVASNYPFTDIEGLWSTDYIIQLYELGLTKGIKQTDGTYIYHPSGDLTRGELLVFITRLLGVNTGEYQNVELPFEDAGAIPKWMLPSVKAMYALRVLKGSKIGGKLYSNVNDSVSREEAMTMLGRVLAAQESKDLSRFADGDSVSRWAQAYVETLVALKVVTGSGGMLNPKSNITRGEAAKLLVKIYGLEKAELTPRPSVPSGGEPETQEPDNPDDLPDTPDRPGEETDDPGLPDESDGPSDGPDQSGEDAGDPVLPEDSSSALPE